jgi:hypothetical protein
MRELTKSLFSFSWVMSLFGAQQTLNLTDPGKAARAFDAVTEAATKEFGGFTKAFFQTGDRVQRQMVDLAFSVFSPNVLDPSQILRTTSDFMRQSAEAVNQGLQTATGKPQSPPPPPSDRSAPPRESTSQHSPGWGPIPGSPPNR